MWVLLKMVEKCEKAPIIINDSIPLSNAVRHVRLWNRKICLPPWPTWLLWTNHISSFVLFMSCQLYEIWYRYMEIMVIRHIFGFGIEFLENKDICIRYLDTMEIDFIMRYSYHTYFSPISTAWYRQLGTGCIVCNVEWCAHLWIILYSQHYFLFKLLILFEEGILGTPVQKDDVTPMVISNYHRWKPNSTKTNLCIDYLCLLLTKKLFERSFKLFQYNTKGRHLSNYQIKLILFSHYSSRYKGLCQNKKHGFDQYSKGGHFCATHITLKQTKRKQCHVHFLNPFVRYFSVCTKCDKNNLKTNKEEAMPCAFLKSFCSLFLCVHKVW